MKKIAFFDTKPYDKTWFEKFKDDFEIFYYKNKLNKDTARLADGFEAVCAFVNDDIDKDTLNVLYDSGVKIIAMRSAGYSNVDIKTAFNKIYIVRVPAYSPYAVAEHSIGLLLTLNRKLHRAYNRTRDFNFSLNGLNGMDLYNKVIGVIGTGKIGRVFIDICRGFNMKVLAYDPYPAKDTDINYVDLDTLFSQSDVISLHCPLTEQTKYILNAEAFEKMKNGVYIINTSRGGLIDSSALLNALNSEKVGGAGLDVYEEEADLFFEDFSGTIIKDDTLALLVSRPNVIITSHQAFLTDEALENIAKTTIDNLKEFFDDKDLTNEICYQCDVDKVSEGCRRNRKEKCF